jgi:hypothetical protein
MNKCFFFLGIVMPFFLQAQSSIPCASFCVTEVTLDTLNEQWNVNIDFEGTTNDFINYPYVSIMIGSSGDTVAIGTMEYFGQIGGTSQVYHPSVVSGDFETGQIFFVYDQDTCVLNFPCASAGIAYNQNSLVAVAYASEGWLWQSDERIANIDLYSAQGTFVGSWKNTSHISYLTLPSGSYFYILTCGQKKQTGKLIRP